MSENFSDTSPTLAEESKRNSFRFVPIRSNSLHFETTQVPWNFRATATFTHYSNRATATSLRCDLRWTSFSTIKKNSFGCLGGLQSHCYPTIIWRRSKTQQIHQDEKPSKSTLRWNTIRQLPPQWAHGRLLGLDNFILSFISYCIWRANDAVHCRATKKDDGRWYRCCWCSCEASSYLVLVDRPSSHTTHDT